MIDMNLFKVVNNFMTVYTMHNRCVVLPNIPPCIGTCGKSSLMARIAPVILKSRVHKDSCYNEPTWSRLRHFQKYCVRWCPEDMQGFVYTKISRL